jgi:hypothetical protein
MTELSWKFNIYKYRTHKIIIKVHHNSYLYNVGPQQVLRQHVCEQRNSVKTSPEETVILKAYWHGAAKERSFGDCMVEGLKGHRC